MSLSQPKISADISPYGNYHKNHTKNILMNRVNIDSGYPQDIFAKITPHQDLDYVQDNKKNLKNFFKDRIPPNQITKDSFKLKTINLDPVRMFQIKRHQYELKNQTKITLNNSFLDKKNKLNFESKNLQKISEIFFINDKNYQLKQKFGQTATKRFDSYSKDNHRKGTRSFVQKRTKLIKQQAYQKVFGPDISSVSRTLPMKSYLQNSQNFTHKNKAKSTTLQRKKSYLETMQTKRQELSKLIKKIDNYKQKMKPVKLDYQQQNQNISNSVLENFPSVQIGHKVSFENVQNVQETQQNRQKVVNLIKNFTNIYKQQSIQNNRNRIQSIQDLQKVDAKFFTQLSQHKKNRMQKRLFQLYKYSVPQSLLQNKIQKFSDQRNRNVIQYSSQNNNSRIHERKPSETLTITDNGDLELHDIIQNNVKRRPSIKDRFRLLAIAMIKAVLQADIYMVDHSYIYSAFWQQRIYYQMQGSYAFFKAIKLGDLQSVKTFINLDLGYLYEKQSTGKTPLAYACQQNKQQIAEYFLYLGSNVDKKCLNKKTALYYALQNQNVKLVKLLLQYGAHPWSSKDLPYKKMCDQISDKRFEILFSNAKKIFLGVRIQKGSKKRSSFWHQNKSKIVQTQRIQF